MYTYNTSSSNSVQKFIVTSTGLTVLPQTSYAVITIAIQLLYEYDYDALCTPASIRCKQKMDMSVFHCSRIAVESNACHNFDHFCCS